MSISGIGNTLKELGNDFVEEAAKIYEDSSWIVDYLCSIYETLSGMVGFGCYNSGCGILEGGKALLNLSGKGIEWIDRQVGQASALCGYATYHFLCTLERVALRVNDLIGIIQGACGHGSYVALLIIKRNVATTAVHTARFVKANWPKIIGYILAWGIFFACSGTLYGFNAVAIPLSIGFGVGCGVGGMLGVLTVTVFDTENKGLFGVIKCLPSTQDQARPHVLFSFWNIVNYGIELLDPHGTRQIVLAISVTVLLASSVVFPYALGGVFGLLVGNQVITKIGYDLDLGTDPKNRKHQILNMKHQTEEMGRKIDELLQRLEQMDQNGQH
ncbi:MAG: hypothetical protein JJU12_05555 [Chlamydiales bacterium]|nr:hypothetical protein [Chlamydiales bacterium]